MQKIHFEVTGKGSTALVFVHGWQGNNTWWNAQRDHFSKKYMIAQMDLPGHGQSEGLTEYSSTKYAEAIKYVVDNVSAQEVILVGHSMSGAYVLEASLMIQKVKALIIVDTLKNLDEVFTPELAEKYMYSEYRKDFKHAIYNIMPQYLFSSDTPFVVKARLQQEFLSTSADHAIKVIEPLYKMDLQSLAKEVRVPVRAINSDFSPTNIEANKKYFKNYDCFYVSRAGHYPMLENPEEFNERLDSALASV